MMNAARVSQREREWRHQHWIAAPGQSKLPFQLPARLSMFIAASLQGNLHEELETETTQAWCLNVLHAIWVIAKALNATQPWFHVIADRWASRSPRLAVSAIWPRSAQYRYELHNMASTNQGRCDWLGLRWDPGSTCSLNPDKDLAQLVNTQVENDLL